MANNRQKHQNLGRADLRWLLPGLILLAGVLLSFYVAHQTEQLNSLRVRQLLEVQARDVSHEIEHYVSLYQYGLRGMRGAILTAEQTGHFNYRLMQVYTQSREYQTEFPGSRGFGFIQRVTQAQRAEFIEAAAAERPDGQFALRQLQPNNEDLFIIRYIEPEANNRQAVGLDIGSEANRRQAALRAARENEMVITAPITLVQAEKKTAQGFLMLLPIYKNGARITEPAERLQHLVGWAYTPLLIEEVLAAIEYKTEDLLIRLQDQASTMATPFYAKGDFATQAAAFSVVQSAIQVGGRQWLMTLAPTQQYIQGLALPTFWREFIEWLLMSSFVALLTYTGQLVIARRLAFSRHQIDLALAEERTLKEANARLEENVHARTAQLAKLGALNRSVLAASPYALIATDPDGKITVFNPSAEQLLGYDAADLIGMQTPAIFHLPEEIEQRAQMLSAELGKEIPAGFEVFVCKARGGQIDQNIWTYRRKDGRQLKVNLSVTALHNDAGQLEGFLGVAQDLEPQLKRERELEEAREKALQASKAKTEFLANVSHEIRTPMNGILGLLRIVLNGEMPAKQRDYLNRAHQSALSLLSLLNDILDFSKIEAGKLDIEIRPLVFTDLLEDMATLLAPQAEQKNIELIFDLTPELPQQITTDGNRLRQILMNLVGNAIKFTQQGNVVVSVSLLHVNGQRAQLQICVNDDGIGMTQEQVEGLFQEFRQADSSISRRFGGTGLGLAIVRKLLHLLEGDIQVSSVFGRGSQFKFTIPIEIPEQVTPTPLRMHGVTVMVVDAHPASRMVLQALLLQVNCDVIALSHAEQARSELIRRQQTGRPVRLVLVDWELPDARGTQLIQDIGQMTELTEAPATVLMMGYQNKFSENHQSDSASPILLKPVLPDRLITVLRKAFNMVDSADNLVVGQQAATAGAGLLTGLHILLVEDNPTNRIVATELLSQAGAQVSEAFDGYEAISQLKLRPFDVVLMDLQMPGISGIETTHIIRQQLAITDIPIIAMTANATKDDKAACKAAGMNDHIGKPFEIEKVISLLLTWTHRKDPDKEPTKAAIQALPLALLDFAKAQDIAVEAAYARLGSLELYYKVVRQFGFDIAVALDELRKPDLTQADARIIYHSLKSGAANCGLQTLSLQLKQAEEQCINTRSSMHLAEPAVLQGLEMAQPILSTWLTLMQPAALSTAAQQQTDDATFDAMLDTLQSLLADSDMQAMDLFQQLKALLMQNYPELTVELETQLNQLAFPACLVLLQQIRTEEQV